MIRYILVKIWKMCHCSSSLLGWARSFWYLGFKIPKLTSWNSIDKWLSKTSDLILNRWFMLIHVCLHYTFYSIALWVEDVTIQRKTMICLLFVWWNCCAESECWDLFVVIIVLKNTSNWSYCVEILICRVQGVKWISLLRIPIWHCEVNCNWKAYLTATEDIL